MKTCGFNAGEKDDADRSIFYVIRWPNVGISGWHHVVLAGIDVGPTVTHHWNQGLAQRHII